MACVIGEDETWDIRGEVPQDVALVAVSIIPRAHDAFPIDGRGPVLVACDRHASDMFEEAERDAAISFGKFHCGNQAALSFEDERI